jgi:hypothetical protein
LHTRLKDKRLLQHVAGQKGQQLQCVLSCFQIKLHHGY